MLNITRCAFISRRKEFHIFGRTKQLKATTILEDKLNTVQLKQWIYNWVKRKTLVLTAK